MGKLSAYNLARKESHFIRLPVDSNVQPVPIRGGGRREPGVHERPLLTRNSVPSDASRCVIRCWSTGTTCRRPKAARWYRAWPWIPWCAPWRSSRVTNFLDSDDGACKLTCAELYNTTETQAPRAHWKMVLPPTALLLCVLWRTICVSRPRCVSRVRLRLMWETRAGCECRPVRSLHRRRFVQFLHWHLSFEDIILVRSAIYEHSN